MSIDSPENKDNQTEVQKKQEQEKQKTINNLKNSPDDLEGQNGNKVISSIKDDINTKLINANDPEAAKKVNSMLEGKNFTGQLNKQEAKELSDIYKEIDKVLSTEAGENSKSGNDFIKNQSEQKKEFQKNLLDAVEKLADFLKTNNEKKQGKITKDKAQVAENNAATAAQQASAEIESGMKNFPTPSIEPKTA